MKEFDLSGIKNIIFDLGNVIINLDMPATDRAFEKLCGENYDRIMGALNKEGFFQLYETGNISTNDFIKRIKDEIGTADITETKIAAAWNAMLLDIPPKRFDILKELKKNYRLFCLSNTNDLHIRFINEMLQRTKGIKNLDGYFEKVYLSHEMNQRKPDVAIFKTVVFENNLMAEETLFIDDTAGHLEGAEKVGLQTFHMDESRNLEDFF